MTTTRRPGPAAIRRALDECMTVDDIAAALGVSRGSVEKMRQRDEPVGLPAPDAHLGRTPLWFRASFEVWEAARPGRGVGGGRPRRGR